ncbi:MAG: mannose-1-phosphate guanylyltransferase [Candidatus Omnitrophica bacterium CG11_big_fil_rev_8_21_14_0_20_64_10]|nr:MAG: mannose-1-phosphate guanylyltransferase [Candidatus Omnitrophica bacterium CG11_big_fil_rev_8_21_14_0_20_64_10]
MTTRRVIHRSRPARLWTVIMAGGSGERLWPLSRKSHPKQTLKLGARRTLLQVTAERLKRICPINRTVVVTTRNQAELIARQLPRLPKRHLLVEPASRNTAAAVGLGTLAILREDPEAVILVAPADHIIEPASAFYRTVRTAVALATKQEGLVCLGIKPSYPATGFGYIEPIQRRVPPGGFQVKRFLEKPDVVTARKLIRRPGMSWNSGIFCWQGAVIMEEIRLWLPRLYAGLTAIDRVLGSAGGAGLNAPRVQGRLNQLYRGLPSISIDVGVLERSRRVWMVPARFLWDDVGSWNSLGILHGRDADGNIVVGSHLGISTENSIVVGAPGHLIATAGLRDLVIVQTPDATLVCHKAQAQGVRKLVAAMAASAKLRKYLS